MSRLLIPACLCIAFASPCAGQTVLKPAPSIAGAGVAEQAPVAQPSARTVRAKPRRAARPSPPKRAALVRIAAATRDATREPLASAFINAVQVYPWSDGAVYRLYGAPERVTDIALQPGETLIAIAAGDTVRWTVGDTTSGSGDGKRTHILIKPFSAGLRTNLLVTTDKRSYHLQLESTAATAMSAISWVYPQEALAVTYRTPVLEPVRPAPAAAAAAGLALEALRFDYGISGDRPSWRPLRAFDDGRQVFIEFPASLPQGEAPPLFVIGEDGSPQIVNYRLAGRYYVVDRLFDAAELRLGTKRQQVVRIERASARATKREGRRS